MELGATENQSRKTPKHEIKPHSVRRTRLWGVETAEGKTSPCDRSQQTRAPSYDAINVSNKRRAPRAISRQPTDLLPLKVTLSLKERNVAT